MQDPRAAVIARVGLEWDPSGTRVGHCGVVSRRRSATVTAGLLFLVLVAVAYAGADHPPPPGFWLLVALLAAWSALLGVLLVRFLGGRTLRRWVLIAAGGGVGSCVIAVVLVAVQLARSSPVSVDAVIGLVVVTLAGAAVACGGGIVAGVLVSQGREGA